MSIGVLRRRGRSSLWAWKRIGAALLLTQACVCRPLGVNSTQLEALRVEPSDIDFGEVFIGATPQRVLTITNPNRSPTQAELTVAAPFSVTPEVLSLGGGESALVSVGVLATVEGAVEATLTVTDANGRVMVPARVVGRAPLECRPLACETSTFDSNAGQCLTQRLANGTPCAAPESCFVSAECSSGVCVGRLSTCDDGNPCTVDACGAQGCAHSPVACPVASACAVAFCSPDAGCQQREVDDGVSCGPSDCASAFICLSGQCQRRQRPNAALDCSYDELQSGDGDLCVLTRGGEVRCWGRTGPRFVNGPRKVPTPPGFRFIPNHGGPVYGVDQTGMPWRFESPGVFARVPTDGGRYSAPVSMAASAGGPGTEALLVGDGVALSLDVRLLVGAGVRAVVRGAGGGLILLLSDGGLTSGTSLPDLPDFGEPLDDLEAAGWAVCGRTAPAVRCFSRSFFLWAETLRSDAGAFIGGFNQRACLGSADGTVWCSEPEPKITFPTGLRQLTRNHSTTLCGLIATGEVYCHAPKRNDSEPGGLGDLSTLPPQPVEVPLSEPAVTLTVLGAASFAATATGIWAWGAGFGDDGDGGPSPRLLLPASGVRRLIPYSRGYSVSVAWLDDRDRLFGTGPGPGMSAVRKVFDCGFKVSFERETRFCGVRTDGGWFWADYPPESFPEAQGAPFVASAGRTFLVSDGGVVTHAEALAWSTTRPVPLPGPARFVSEDCAVLTDGRVFCGMNAQARQVTGLLPAREVFGSYDGGCALVGTNGVQCWGSNQYGQLANDAPGSANPVFVTMPEPVVEFAGPSSWGHACALLRSGKIRCWGDNRRGQLGPRPVHSTSGPIRMTQ